MANKINLSGHCNPGLKAEGFTFPGAIHLENEFIEREGPEGVAKAVFAWLECNVPLEETTQTEIALPGLPLLRDIVVAWVHGRTGCFPVTRTSRRQADGSFVFDSGLDLQDLRNQARKSRRGPTIIG